MNSKLIHSIMAGAVTACLCMSCNQNNATPPAESATEQADSASANNTFTVDTLYNGFNIPWGLTWLPDGRLLVTEKKGEILIFKDDKYTGEKVTGLPAVASNGQGGLLDIVAHPNYAQNQWIYISYAKPVEGGAATAIARFKLNGNAVVEFKDLFVAKPFLPADFHFGSRIVFDKNNFMFFSSGERGTQPKVWELDNDHGKIHRLLDDGTVPADNPFVKQKGANGSIWSYGHRNPQGMVYDAATDRVWEAEHGPKGGDELNLIEKGKNYGWPKASYGINYDGTILTPNKELPGVTNPVRYWVPSIGPCGITIVAGDRYPGWKGNIMVGALAFRHLARVELKDTTYVTEEKLMQDVGRVRDVKESPDGYLYVITEGPGKLLKLLPKQ